MPQRVIWLFILVPILFACFPCPCFRPSAAFRPQILLADFRTWGRVVLREIDFLLKNIGGRFDCVAFAETKTNYLQLIKAADLQVVNIFMQ